MPSCVLRKCKNYGSKINKSEGISYHTFPSDDLVNHKWVSIVQAERSERDWMPTKSSTICSVHFKQEDIYTTSKGYMRLKKTAVPVITPDNDDVLKLGSPTSLDHDMAIDLYYTPGSAPCRIVLLVAAALDIQLNLNQLNLMEGEQLKPDFLKLNPQHTVPTIVDNGFALWESRAISRYLVNKYGGESTLYPSDPQTKALVDQRLDFDLGTLYPRFAGYFYPQVFGGAPANEAQLKKLEEALVFFNTFLDGGKYAVGSELTLADLSLVATVSTIDAAGISLTSYPNVEKWFELVKTTAPGYEEANQKGIDAFKEFLTKLIIKSEL